MLNGLNDNEYHQTIENTILFMFCSHLKDIVLFGFYLECFEVENSYWRQ